MKIQFLPFSLFSFLALVAAAAPVSQKELSPVSFKQIVSQGVWLVEYFSPYCHHCREFAPTWERLQVENEKLTDPGIHLAQVNCAVHGDFCLENGVRAYPQITLYKGGNLVEVYKGARDFDILQEYINKNAEGTPHSVVPHTIVPPPPETHHPNPAGDVLVLDSTNFNKAVTERPIFVKFFAPWCGHCKRLAPTWIELARHMQHKLDIAEVDCEANGALCTSQHIQGYPTLVFFNKDKSEYTGGRKLEQLMAFVNDVSAPPVRELADENLEKQIASNAVMFLLLHTKSNNDIVNQVTQASRVLLGSPPIHISSSPVFFSRYNIPAASTWVLMAFKDNDSVHPTAKLFGLPPDAESALKTWLLENRLPTSTELTQDTFQNVMKAPHQPLVVIAAVTKETSDEVAMKFRDIGKAWNKKIGNHKNGDSKDVIFTWMDGEKWGSWLKNMYGIKVAAGSPPAIVVADHARLSYYDVDQDGQPIKPTFTSILSAIDGISSGKIKQKSSENFVARMVGYLSDKVVSVEMQIINHPWKTLFFVSSVLVLVYLILRYCTSEDPGGESRNHRQGYGKASRLD